MGSPVPGTRARSDGWGQAGCFTGSLLAIDGWFSHIDEPTSYLNAVSESEAQWVALHTGSLEDQSNRCLGELNMAIVDELALRTLFTEARAHNGWNTDAVSNEQLRMAYDLAKWGPTSMNTQPMRLVIVRSAEAKARLVQAMSAGNVEKTLSAPVVAIVAFDTDFAVHLPRLFPHNANAMSVFSGDPALTMATAFRNGTLQGAYFLLSLRAIGLDVGPMSGFDAAKVDAEFLAGTSFKSNFLCAIGRGDPAKIYKRSPRFEFDEIAHSV